MTRKTIYRNDPRGKPTNKWQVRLKIAHLLIFISNIFITYICLFIIFFFKVSFNITSSRMNFPTDSPVLVLSEFYFTVNVGRGPTASDEITASIKSVSGWHALYSHYMHPVARVSTRFSSRNITGSVRRMLMTQESTKFHQLVGKMVHFLLFFF